MMRSVPPPSAFGLAAALALSGCADSPDSSPPPRTAPVFGYAVLDTLPHDHDAFTQGLIHANGVFYESTGEYGDSELREVDPATGRVLRSRPLEPQFWGEGLTLMGDRLVQLTWMNRIGFVWDRTSFDLLETFTYPTEGWGLTHDGSRLILSDGSANLYFLEPETFTEVARVTVLDGDRLVTQLNELEFVRGEVWANVWQTDRIARIDPRDGRVTGWIDLRGLLPFGACPAPADVLNGIAYDAAGDRLFVTGKNWCRVYEIRVVGEGPSAER